MISSENVFLLKKYLWDPPKTAVFESNLESLVLFENKLVESTLSVAKN